MEQGLDSCDIACLIGLEWQYQLYNNLEMFLQIASS